MSSAEKPSRKVPAFSEPLQMVHDRRTMRNPNRPAIESVVADGKTWMVRGFSDKEILRTQHDRTVEGTFTDRSLIVKNLFNEIQNKYGIATPTQFMIDEVDEKNPTLFMMTEVVEGDNRKKLSAAEKKVLCAEEESTLRKLFTYYQDKAKSEEEFLCDIGDLGQYRFGTLAGEKEKHLYLVDTDPYYATLTSPTKRWFLLVSSVLDIMGSIIYMQKEYGVDLQDFYKECKTFSDHYAATHHIENVVRDLLRRP